MSALDTTGPYDRLYGAANPLLWSGEPGRVVARAARRLPPGRALDLGCGDGRNILWLEQNGWMVDGVDVSSAALAAARKRFDIAGHVQRGTLTRADVGAAVFPKGAYHLVLVYGLYHCIPDSELTALHQRALSALRLHGMMAFSALTDGLPLPADHGTGRLWLRSSHELRRLMTGLRVLSWEEGEIAEDHLPLVGPHKHAAVWGLVTK